MRRSWEEKVGMEEAGEQELTRPPRGFKNTVSDIGVPRPKRYVLKVSIWCDEMSRLILTRAS